MKKVFLFACIAFLTVSCTLYMDEDDSILNDDELPVYTGEGYDEVITEKDEDFVVSYQLKSNVRKFVDDMQRHVLEVIADSNQLLVLLDFSLDTPRELLPVKGDILVSHDNLLFPEGFAHYVLGGANIGNRYRFVTCAADLRDIFSTLDVDGTLRLGGDDQTAISTRGDNDVEERENEYHIDEKVFFKGFSYPHGPLTFSLEDNKSYVRNDFKAEFKMHDFIPQLIVEEKCWSEWTFSIQASVPDFQIKNAKIKFEKKLFEEKDIIRKRLKKSLNVRVGPVVLKFGLGVKGTLNCDLSATGHITHRSQSTTSFKTPQNYILFGNQKQEKIQVNMSDNTDYSEWNVDGEVSGSLGVTLSLIPKVGLFTKGIGFSFPCSFYYGIKASSPPLSTSVSDSVDISNNSALELVPTFSIDAVVMADLNLKALAANVIGGLVGDAGFLLELANYISGNPLGDVEQYKDFQEIAKQFEEYADYIEGEGELADDDPAKNKFENALKGPHAFTFNIYSTDIESLHVTTPWYPKLDDKALRVGSIKHYEDNDGLQRADFKGIYKIEDRGIFASRGSKFYPKLLVKCGDEKIGVFSASGVIDKSSKLSTEYVFNIKGLKPGIEYRAIPCYSETKDGKPKWYDKALPFSTTFPLFSIVWVTQDKCDYSHMSASTSLDGKEHDAYIFEFSSITSCQGSRTHKVTNMGIEASWKGKNGSQGTTSQDWPYTVNGITYGIKDGEYTNGWRITTIDDPQVDLTLTPWMDVVDKETGVKTHIKFTPYKIQLSY